MKASNTAGAYAHHAENMERKRHVEKRELQVEMALSEKDRLGGRAGKYGSNVIRCVLDPRFLRSSFLDLVS